MLFRSDAIQAGSHWSPPESEALPFNLDKAKTDLAAAGYTDTDGNGTVNDPVTGTDVVLNYFTRTSDQNTIKTAPFIKDWLSQIGVGLNVQSVSSGKLTTIIEAGNYDMFEWGWFPSPDPNFILGIFTCDQRAPKPGVYGNNDSFFCDSHYDQLYHDQLATKTVQERIDILHQMQQILWEQMPYIMVSYTDYLEAYRTDRFTGYIMQPAGNGDLLATWGPFAFINMSPVSGSSAAGGNKIPAGVWIGIVLALVIIAVVISMARRRGREEDRA